MSPQISKAAYVALLNAYLGAREHERWAHDHGTAAEVEAAEKAAQEAREALIRGAGYEP